MVAQAAPPLRIAPALPATLFTHFVEGRDAILHMSFALCRLAELCQQPGAMQDMAYFLAKPGLLKRVPVLMLLSDRPFPSDRPLSPDHLLGALLLYDNRMAGCSTRVFTTNDRSGRNTLIAPAALRSSLAEFAARALVKRGAHVVMISFRDETPSDQASSWTPPVSPARKEVLSRWARRERGVADYLPLQATYEDTLAQIGRRTRNHMRYYRRRAEKELGCTFVPAVELSRGELLAFNRTAMFAVPDRVAAWRYDILKDLAHPLFMGIRHQDGRWLSLVGGRRFGSYSEILWQMNRDGLPLFSLSLVMRAYFIEHEIEHGATRFYLEGGTSHPISNSFINEKIIDLAVLRRSPMALLTRRLARHVVPGDNELAKMFSDSELQWR